MREESYALKDDNGFTARCFGCRNRYGLVNLIVLGSGVLCCRRCWANHTSAVPTACEALEIQG